MITKSVAPIALGAAAFLLRMNLATSLHAQSLASIRVGQPSSKLSALGPASASDTYKGMEVSKWVLPTGSDFSAAIGSSGQIVYAELDWGGKGDTPECDLSGLRFGITTLSELRKRFGSNGFAFKGRPASIETHDGLAMLNSYQAGAVVVTFYTKINAHERSRVNGLESNSSPAEWTSPTPEPAPASPPSPGPSFGRQ
jgi:hypothetical protein